MDLLVNIRLQCLGLTCHSTNQCVMALAGLLWLVLPVPFLPLVLPSSLYSLLTSNYLPSPLLPSPPLPSLPSPSPLSSPLPLPSLSPPLLSPLSLLPSSPLSFPSPYSILW